MVKKVPLSAIDDIWAATKAGIEVRKHKPRQYTPWDSEGRPEQQEPDGSWRIWYLQGGRGSGKTRAGSEWMRKQLETQPAGYWAIVAPTFADARDKCVEGPSGLLQALKREGPDIASYNKSPQNAHIITSNGHTVYLDGAHGGAERIQGYNLSGAWCDEIGLWPDWKKAWHESVAFAVRIQPGRIVATGTPKTGHGLVRLLVDDKTGDVVRSHLRTGDNIDNLSEDAVRELERRYKGTHLERQELHGEFIKEVPGALWSRDLIERNRRNMPDEFRRLVVAIDPAATSGIDSDETGLIVAGGAYCDCTGTHEIHTFILRDVSSHYKPQDWAARAIREYRMWEGDHIIAERNNGGEMVEATIRNVDRNVPVKTIHASRGKKVRAEPIAALYEQGKVHHCGFLPELENQMAAFTGEPGNDDDRVDAMVYAVSELMGTAGYDFLLGWAG